MADGTLRLALDAPTGATRIAPKARSFLGPSGDGVLLKSLVKSDAGKKAYRKRKWISEAPHGWIKNVLGFRQFSFRGLSKVTSEWKLLCAALNLRRMPARLQFA